ncbi:hypothetical protein PBI_BLUEBERRY_43 [Gordonia phage Blueberry]|nr:hypothetical protein BH771_gp43 [Gordonia phage Blueberry]ANA85505.1 hypothetical protein PBI_BLUEBERRY_43 [Gordonia phage Blueberry]QZD97476.1 immunity repressor [Gordonia phage MissRona]
MTKNVARLGTYLVERRRQLGLSQLDVWKAGGPSNSTLTGIENGTAPKVSPSTMRKLDAALQWEEGSANRTLEGGEPTPVERSADNRATADLHDIATLLDRLIEDTAIIVNEAREVAGPGSRVYSIAEDAQRSAVDVGIHILGGPEAVMDGAVEILTLLGDDSPRPDSLLEALVIVIKAQIATNSIWGGPMIQARQTATSFVEEELDAPPGDDYDLVGRDVGGPSETEMIRRQMDADAERGDM